MKAGSGVVHRGQTMVNRLSLFSLVMMFESGLFDR